MNTAFLLAIAMVLDGLLGEPRWLWSRLPHPAILMGRVVGWLDTTFNRGGAKRVKGVLVTALLVAGAATAGYILSLGGPVIEIVVAAVLLAQKSLVDHVRAVADGLRVSLGDGRRAVAMIVGRDTADMDTAAVTRGAIESAAENLSDGIIAPAFWFLLAGLPGLLVYKFVNTADSMIGYRNEKYADFGWAAARLDDLLNLAPARLTAFLVAVCHGRLSGWSAIAKDAGQHRSPNAGWPEAAMARALGVALSGPRSYHGQMRDFPYVNAGGQVDIGPKEIDATCAALWRTWATALAALLLGAVVMG